MTHTAPARWLVGAAAMLLTSGGCEGIVSPPDDRVTVINALRDTVAFSIMTQEYASLVDPSPFPPSRADFAGRILPPGGTLRVPVSDITSYRKKADLYVFVWRVKGDTIRSSSSFAWSYAGQRKSLFRVAIAD